jgi:hypothetical protein
MVQLSNSLPTFMALNNSCATPLTFFARYQLYYEGALRVAKRLPCDAECSVIVDFKLSTTVFGALSASTSRLLPVYRK